MTFRLTARLVAAVCAVLFVIFLVAPQSYSPTYGVASDAAGAFMTRRAAPMFLAPMLILWAASGTARSPLRDTIAIGVAVMYAGVALTGISAWVQGIASPMILLAAAGEALLAALLWATRKN